MVAFVPNKTHTVHTYVIHTFNSYKGKSCIMIHPYNVYSIKSIAIVSASYVATCTII